MAVYPVPRMHRLQLRPLVWMRPLMWAIADRARPDWQLLRLPCNRIVVENARGAVRVQGGAATAWYDAALPYDAALLPAAQGSEPHW